MLSLRVFLAVSLLCILCSSQTCETFRGDPPYCTKLIDYTVFVPAGLSQTDLAKNISALTNTYSLIPEPCRASTVQLACSKTFRSCSNDTLTNSLAIEILCNEICTAYNTDCSGLISSNLAPAENCTAADPYTPSAPLYVPPGQSQQCAIANASEEIGVICVEPFVLNLDTGSCSIKCPPPGFDDPHWQHIWRNTGLITLSLSLVCEVILMATWAALWNPERQLYVFPFAASIMITNFGMFIGKWLPYEKWMCIKPWKLRDQSNIGAALAGALTTGGTLSASCWILVLLYHLVNLSYENRFQIFGPGKLLSFINVNTAYHFFCWFLVPVPIVTAVFAGNWMNLSAAWLAYPDAQSHHGWILYGFLFVPLTVLQVAHFILIGMLFWRIFTVSGRLGFQAQARLVILCVYYIIAIGYSIFYGWYQLSVRQALTDRITEYATCKLGADPSSCKRVPYLGGVAGYITSLLTTTLGIGVLLLLLDRRLLRMWGGWVTLRSFRNSDTTASASGAVSQDDKASAL